MERFVYDSREFQDELAASAHHAGEVKLLQSITRPGMHVVEAGANRGVTAVALAKAIGPTGHLSTFEPVPEFYAELTENLAGNGVKNASAYNMALSNRKGRIRFYKHGGGSGVTPADDAEMIWVEATTLADFVARHRIERIDILNMDCEGSELAVFEGGKAVLAQQTPQIFCEIHHDYLKQLGKSVHDVTSFLTAVGYEVRPVRVEDLDAESTLEDCSHIYARNRVQQESVQELNDRITDLKGRMPAHSANPAMMQELEELEQQLKTVQENPGL